MYKTKEEGIKDGVPADRLTSVTTYSTKGVFTEWFDMGEDLQETLKAAQAEYKRLEEAGTPYWCVCEPPRSVAHERAYWKPDTYEGPAFDGIHGKHGVMCADCGGYIQEG